MCKGHINPPKKSGRPVKAYGIYSQKRRNDERVETFFSPWMRHHAGRPTTGHSTETMGINTYSQRETDNYTQTLDK